MEFKKKVNVKCPMPWSHHHSGWPFCNSLLRKNFHEDNGTILYTNGIFEEIIKSKKIHTKSWIGFLHATPNQELEYYLKNNLSFLKSLNYCKGIFALSKYVCNFLEKNIKNILINKIFLCVKESKFNFDFNLYEKNKNKKILMAGHWLRNFENFYDLNAINHKKIIINCTNKKHPGSVETLPYLNCDLYEKMFSDNIMFLSLQDASANNFIVECIVRNTPIVVNRLPAVEEYLGKEYPLFYDNLQQAEEMINNLELIKKTNTYLKKINKYDYTSIGFINNFNDSDIYKNLKNILDII
jgi:hypothetical protein